MRFIEPTPWRHLLKEIGPCPHFSVIIPQRNSKHNQDDLCIWSRNRYCMVMFGSTQNISLLKKKKCHMSFPHRPRPWSIQRGTQLLALKVLNQTTPFSKHAFLKTVVMSKEVRFCRWFIVDLLMQHTLC